MKSFQGKECYLVEVDCLFTDFLGEVDELEAVLGEVVHLHEVVSVLKLAEYGVLLPDGSETGVGVVPGVLALALEGLAALSQILEVSVELATAGRMLTSEEVRGAVANGASDQGDMPSRTYLSTIGLR